MITSGRLKLEYYEKRRETLNTKSQITKNRLNRMNSTNVNLSILPKDPEVRYYNNNFEFKINNKWLSDSDLFSHLINNSSESSNSKNNYNRPPKYIKRTSIDDNKWNINKRWYLKSGKYEILTKPSNESEIKHKTRGGYYFKILDKSNVSYYFIETEKDEKGYISKDYLPHIKFSTF